MMFNHANVGRRNFHSQKFGTKFRIKSLSHTIDMEFRHIIGEKN